MTPARDVKQFVSPGTSNRDNGPPDRRDDYYRERRSESSDRASVKALAGHDDKAQSKGFTRKRT